jgi:hypothetical protein
MTTTTERLKRLQGRGTAYEIAFHNVDGKMYLVGYAPPGKAALLRAMQRKGDQILALAGDAISDDSVPIFTGSGTRVALYMGEIIVQFTGRTEREAIQGHAREPYGPDNVRLVSLEQLPV